MLVTFTRRVLTSASPDAEEMRKERCRIVTDLKRNKGTTSERDLRKKTRLGVGRVGDLVGTSVTLADGVDGELLLVEVAEVEPESDSTAEREDGHDTIVP